MEHKYIEILKLLLNGSYVTASAVSLTLKVSLKTVRIRMKELDEIGKERGFRIISKPHYGYHIQIQDEKMIRDYIDEFAYNNRVPNSVDERTCYLLAFLVNHSRYIKQEELCDFLFVSRTTLQYSIKNIEKIIEPYDIKFDRKPNFGMRLVGRESDFRRCIGDYFVRQNFFENVDSNRQNQELKALGDVVMKLEEIYNIHMSETAFETFIHHIYIAIKRIRKGFEAETLDSSKIVLSLAEQEFIRHLIEELQSMCKVRISPGERTYICVYFAGKRTVELDESANFVITEESRKTVKDILELVFQEYNIDLRGDFNVQMMLCSHLAPFDIRIRYGIGNRNAMTEEIKKKYMFPYAIASGVGGLLREKYGRKISDDEISYFAIIFAIALKKMSRTAKSNILIVCNSGKGSSMLLLFKYKEEFGEYLDHIYVSDLVHLAGFDFGKIDYVFTTVPINIKIPVPIVEISMFLEVDDIIKVRHTLKSSKKDYLKNYYRMDRFFTGIQGDGMEDALKNLCGEIERREELPPGFLKSVLNREKMGTTDFGNLVAMPHPDRLLTEETRVYVAILNYKIKWNHNEVQLILLASIGSKPDHNLMRFYEDTMQAIQDKEGVRRLLEEKTYDALAELFNMKVPGDEGVKY